MRFPALLLLGLLCASFLSTASSASAGSYAALTTNSARDGFWTVDARGTVTVSGGSAFYGDLRSTAINAPIVTIAGTPDDRGYWLVASDGGVFTFGSARFFGSTGALRLNRPIVGMAPTSTGNGYWLVAADGGIFSFGDASFFGSTGSLRLNQPIVGMASAGAGYWLVASDGGIFSFGNARFLGSTGAMSLNRPIVAMAPTTSRNGYWLLASDGGVFTFGDAPFLGTSLLGASAFGLTPTTDGGYVVLRTDGTLARHRGPAPDSSPTPIAVPAVPSRPGPTPPVTTPPITVPPVTVPPVTTPPVSFGTSPFRTSDFWVDPNNRAAAQSRTWAGSRPADAAYLARIGNTAGATWLGDWTPNVTSAAASVLTAARGVNRVPVFVAYNIPGRDCGQWSAGGSANAAHYRTWIDQLAAGLGAGTSIVVLEPDALPQLDCLDAASRTSRLSLLQYATTTLSARPNTYVYLDAGNPGWHSASEMASRLQSAGVGNARGFALNVSNYKSTTENTSFGNDIAALINKPFVIDTSRNGNGSNGEWCNAMGRALGASPTGNPGNARTDALLWIKTVGESDGGCNGGPNAGEWWPDYAVGLARAAWG